MRTLLANLMDYAGLFPPASLDLPTALANYQKYRGGEADWFVGNFVCPANSLGELAALLAEGTGPMVPVAVIGSRSGPREWSRNLELDATEMGAFYESVGERAEIEAYEVSLPEDVPLTRVIHDLKDFSDIDVFLELSWEGEIHTLLTEMAESDWLLAKARTGGAAAPPSARLLGSFLHSCCSLDLPFKLTAGLHHPFHDRQHHGFLNLLAATTLIYEEEVPSSTVVEIVEAKPESIQFADDQLSWNDLSGGLAAMEAARETLLSIGSCSIDEPLADLRAANLC